MSRMCQVTGKKPLAGNKVSHSHRKTKRVQKPNLLKKRIYIPEDNRTITVKLSARALRSMNRKGAKQVLKEHGYNL